MDNLLEIVCASSDSEQSYGIRRWVDQGLLRPLVARTYTIRRTKIRTGYAENGNYHLLGAR